MEAKEEAEGVVPGQKEELIARLVLGTSFSEKAALRRAGFPRTSGSKKKKLVNGADHFCIHGIW